MRGPLTGKADKLDRPVNETTRPVNKTPGIFYSCFVNCLLACMVISSYFCHRPQCPLNSKFSGYDSITQYIMYDGIYFCCFPRRQCSNFILDVGQKNVLACPYLIFMDPLSILSYFWRSYSNAIVWYFLLKCFHSGLSSLSFRH